MTKPFLTYQQQLDKLENEKGLLIPDRNIAEQYLKRIGYFALIGGYKKPFKNSTTRKYKDNTTFNEIVALYRFDENMRELFLKYMLRIERHIRTLLSYAFVKKFGENQTAYLDANNYNVTHKNSRRINKLIGEITTILQSNDYPYINYQRTQYGNVPLWVLVNVLSFGKLSMMYQFLLQAQQIEISKNFDHINERELQQFLSVLTKFRNVCAHNERLYSYKTKNSIPDKLLHAKLGIPQRGTEYAAGKNDLFAVVIIFRYLLSLEEFKAFKSLLDKYIKSFLKETTHITEADLLHIMGFPIKWKLITTYKI